MVIDNRNITLKFLLLAALVVLLIPTKAQAYIGPGAGFAVVGSLLAIFTATLSAVLALFTWPVRYVIRAIRGRRAFARSRIKKFVVLGLDGMDYALTEKLLAEGKLPNLVKLRQQGCFKRLTTTIPPISPVAWSSFQTGSNPGKHNIFDFLTRDKKSYLPRLSSVDIRSPRRKISLGKYQLPLGKADIRLLRKSKPFWITLGEHGIFSSIIRVPVTFPPEKLYGVQLSGMCVPDLRGTQGTFSFYTTRNDDSGKLTAGESFTVTRNENSVKAELIGPQNPFRKNNCVLKCPFVVTINDKNTAKLIINGNNHTLTKDVYTEWIKLRFRAAPGVRVYGICKFLLLDTTPEFQLYVTPINIDPEKPAMPISYPIIYSTHLAKRQGAFATLGLSEDNWALNEKVLSDANFIQQSIDTDAERQKMFLDSLDKIRRGLCVCVFDGMDRIQHTFWRDIDEKHPAYGQSRQDQEQNTIERLYQRMDSLVGKTLDRCKAKDTVLMVISDHGFNSFRYGIDLNRWLEENGYLKLKRWGRNKKGLIGIDWSETRAFAICLAGIYLNLKGREARGIVDPGDEASRLREEIAGKLIKLTDPARADQRVVKRVYNALRIYHGPYKDEAPDLIVGFNKGYRTSWASATGGVTDRIFHENTKAWSGDHCVDHSLVPGVLFCNRHIETENSRLIDIGPTVLDMFGVTVPGYMDGRPLAVAGADGANSRTEQAQ
jgi:predicted AlkP superfamily phosphohydrolase/phosphomutase